jgi:hypothetical protein
MIRQGPDHGDRRAIGVSGRLVALDQITGVTPTDRQRPAVVATLMAVALRRSPPAARDSRRSDYGTRSE